MPRYYCSSFPKHFDPKYHVGGNKKAQQEMNVKDGVSAFEFTVLKKNQIRLFIQKDQMMVKRGSTPKFS